MYNPNDIDYTPEDRIITLKSVYGGLTKTYVQPAVDKFTRSLLGVKMYSTEEKNTLAYWAHKDSTRELTHGCQFNLRILRDRVDWEWVKHCPMIAMTEQEARDHTNTYTFYVYDEEKEMNNKLQRAELEYKALTYIMNTPDDKLADKARLLNERLENLVPSKIKEVLLNYAKDPDIKKLIKIISIYEDSSSNYKLLLYKLIDRNIVTRTQDVYKFGDIILGVGEMQTVAYLKDPKNKDIYTTLVVKCYPEVASNPEIRKAFLSSIEGEENTTVADQKETKTRSKKSK